MFTNLDCSLSHFLEFLKQFAHPVDELNDNRLWTHLLSWDVKPMLSHFPHDGRFRLTTGFQYTVN